MANKGLITVLTVCAVACLTPEVWAGGAKQEYRMAVEAAKNGQTDFAYMHYRALNRLHARSKYRQQGLFAEGEYHFLLDDLETTSERFGSYVESYPKAKGKIFALAHLYEIARRLQQQEQVDKLHQQIVNLQQVTLVFRDFKEYKFRSPMYRHYRAVFQIDTIEFYADGQLYTKITY